MNPKPVEETVSFSVEFYEDLGFSFHLKEPSRKEIPEQSVLCLLSEGEAERLAKYILDTLLGTKFDRNSKDMNNE